MPEKISRADANKKETKSNNVEKALTIEDVKSLAKEMAIQMFNELIKEETHTVKSPSANKRKVLNLEDLVLVKSNVDGLLIARAKDGRTRVNVKFKDRNDTKWLSVNEIRDLKDHTNLLSKGLVAIEEYESDEHDLEDLYLFLGLGDLYMGDGISPKDLEDVLTGDMDINEFQNALNNSSDIGETILDFAQVLKNEGKIRDSLKLNILKQKVSFSNTYKF